MDMSEKEKAVLTIIPTGSEKPIKVAKCIENELRKKGYLGGDDK